MIELARSRPAAALTRRLAGAAGVEDPGIRWRFAEGPCFDNQVATLEARRTLVATEADKVPHDPEGRDERLELVFERPLS